MNSKSTSTFDMRTVSMLLILAAMWLFFRLVVGSYYFGGDSIAHLSRDMVTWTVLAAGMTLVIAAGHIDLSVGSLLALIAAACAYMVNTDFGLGWSANVAVIVALVLGLVLGLWQGVLTAYFRIPAFIVTLGGMFIFRGITQKVSAQDPRIPDNSWVADLGYKYIPVSIGWVIAVAACIIVTLMVLRSYRRKKRLDLPAEDFFLLALKVVIPVLLILGFVYKVNQAHGIPNQTVVMVAVLLLTAFVVRSTRLGRHIFAIGGNAQAARLSGISVERTTVIVFGIMGLLTAVAAIVWMAQNQGSTKNAGQWYELYAIAACVIGGTSLMGGRGSIFGTLLGALVMATVIQGMDYTDLDNWMQLVVRGAVLVIAVGIDLTTKSPPPWLARLIRIPT